MSDAVHDQWRKELRILLDKVEHQPSAVLGEHRDRIAVLQQLLKSQRAAADA